MNTSIGGLRVTGENHVSASLRPRQMPYRQAWDINRDSAKRDQQLTA